jgi:hypothetical protein
VEFIGIGLIAVPTIAVAYVYLRWHSITTRSAERQGRRPYTQGERALLLIPLLAGIVGTIMIIVAAVANG